MWPVVSVPRVWMESPCVVVGENAVGVGRGVWAEHLVWRGARNLLPAYAPSQSTQPKHPAKAPGPGWHLST